MEKNKDGYGGGSRDRTDGLLPAEQPLSQLSYAPVSVGKGYLTFPVKNEIMASR